MAFKPQIIFNDVTQQWELSQPKADSYIAVDNHSRFLVAPTLEVAEDFLSEEGGKIYGLTHYQHNDEVLPQSNFYKEVQVG